MILDRLISKWSLRRKRPGFRSPLGGLWTDRTDVTERLAAGRFDAEQQVLLKAWVERGFVILRGAVEPGLVDQIRAEVDAAWSAHDPRLLVELDGVRSGLEPALRARHYKLLDQYVFSKSALTAAFAPKLQEFLQLVFERDTLLFQGLTFERGSGDPIHQDTSSVVVTSPLEFAAAWIALEDIVPGSGELEYYPGSHRMEPFYFGGKYRNWNRERDGEALRDEYLESLHTKARAMGLARESFLPSKGDVLVWSADLAHGGSPVRDGGLTRASLVCHYCPRDVRPYYFSYRPKQRNVEQFAPHCFYSSSHYELPAPLT